MNYASCQLFATEAPGLIFNFGQSFSSELVAVAKHSISMFYIGVDQLISSIFSFLVFVSENGSEAGEKQSDNRKGGWPVLSPV
jgi:hypothetical protein